MKTRIIIDSTADLLPEVKASLDIVPLTVHFGDEEYIDGVSITHQEFYKKLVESDALPSTSQATPDAFDKVFRKVADAGEAAVVITLSHKISGTYQSAMIAAEDYENIYVVDSGSVAIGAGILTELALQLAADGIQAQQIAALLEEEKKKIRIVAMVDTLEYLKRGGRVSKTVAFAGSLLNLKPILSVIDGNINTIGKARGTKQGNAVVVAEIEKIGGVNFDKPVLLGYTGVSDERLQDFMENSKDLWAQSKTPVGTCVIGSVIGTHAGPGAVAAAFFSR